jgi:hypothetical protein
VSAARDRVCEESGERNESCGMAHMRHGAVLTLWLKPYERQPVGTTARSGPVYVRPVVMGVRGKAGGKAGRVSAESSWGRALRERTGPGGGGRQAGW